MLKSKDHIFLPRRYKWEASAQSRLGKFCDWFFFCFFLKKKTSRRETSAAWKQCRHLFTVRRIIAEQSLRKVSSLRIHGRQLFFFVQVASRGRLQFPCEAKAVVRLVAEHYRNRWSAHGGESCAGEGGGGAECGSGEGRGGEGGRLQDNPLSSLRSVRSSFCRWVSKPRVPMLEMHGPLYHLSYGWRVVLPKILGERVSIRPCRGVIYQLLNSKRKIFKNKFMLFQAFKN